MNILYYILGGFLFSIFIVLYYVLKLGSFTINILALIDIGIMGLLASLAFFIVDYSMKRKNY